MREARGETEAAVPEHPGRLRKVSLGEGTTDAKVGRGESGIGKVANGSEQWEGDDGGDREMDRDEARGQVDSNADQGARAFC